MAYDAVMLGLAVLSVALAMYDIWLHFRDR